MEPISPELALVDERLDKLARLTLREAPNCLARSDVPRAASPVRHGREKTRVPIACAGLALLCLLGWAVPSSSTPTGPRAAPASPASSEAMHGATPVPAGRVELRWHPVRGAAFYNVILWRGDSRVRDLWPDQPFVRVSRDSLAPGVYRWFVYPALGTGTRSRFGPLVARGTLKA